MSQLTDSMRSTLNDIRTLSGGDMPMNVVIDVDELLLLISEAERAGVSGEQALLDMVGDIQSIDHESERYRIAWRSAQRRATVAYSGWRGAIESFYRVDRESQRYRDAWRSARRRARRAT